MPIHEFDCTECDHTQDEIVGKDIPNDLKCDNCGGALILSTRPQLCAMITVSKTATPSKPKDSISDPVGKDASGDNGDHKPDSSIPAIETERVITSRSADAILTHRETGKVITGNLTLAVTESDTTGQRDIKLIIKPDKPQVGLPGVISLREGIGTSNTAN